VGDAPITTRRGSAGARVHPDTIVAPNTPIIARRVILYAAPRATLRFTGDALDSDLVKRRVMFPASCPRLAIILPQAAVMHSPRRDGKLSRRTKVVRSWHHTAKPGVGRIWP